MAHISIKARQEQFVFLLVLSLFTISLLAWLIFSGSNVGSSEMKDKLSQKINEEEQFETVAAEMRPAVDSTYKKIMDFDPSVQALFLESDILNAIASIKAAYQRKSYDKRYKVFLQEAQLLEVLFYDKKELRGNYHNIEKLNSDLDRCKLSKRGLQEAIINQNRN
ncbi:type VI secretion system TssO [Chitinophaga sp. sic0106]|uniref:type VI secretion system TssO n=1 Tax=Chitinophaga sp. sic0106 TaxID=2854785 RepID=UPI001C44943E|nr:type VI secretion system TssO [Chitinophaga sp. sic0106]MBV7529402.1 type VI secretion system transmembrane protein TssO [Chitinophaga sp. sic0106]